MIMVVQKFQKRFTKFWKITIIILIILKKTEYMTLPANFKNWKEYAQAQICENGEEDEGGFSLESIEDIYFFLLRLGGAEFTIYNEIPLFTDETVGYGCFYD